MATLVLGTVGSLIGGPVGGAIGAMLGRAVDGRLFAPPAREGPRLDELRVQTSSYGTPIPAIWGRMRVSGTVIWASEIAERREQSSGGKGRASQVGYRYSISIAVALSSRPVAAVRRVWAEGQLLVGADGQATSPVTLRLHHGHEDQAVDPLIAAAVGVAACPAYRGIAYVVLEDLALGPFGNRLPSLTFEMEGEGDAPTLATPLVERLGAADADAPAVQGLALTDPDLSAHAELIAPFAPLERAAGAGWRIGADARAPVSLSEAAGTVVRRTSGAPARPRALSVDVYEPARDYQAARASAPVVGGEGAPRRIALPAAMPLGMAQALVEGEAARAGTNAPTERWPQGFAALALAPGRAVRLSDGSLRHVRERNVEGDGVELLLEHPPLPVPARTLPADPGTPWQAPDASAGEGVLAMVRVPAGVGAADAPRLLVAAAGSGAGWRQGELALVASPGALETGVGAVAAAAVVGRVVTLPTPATTLGWDDDSAVEVELAGEHMALTGADDAALLGGANLMACDGELLQFGVATPLGEQRWRLTRLLRGRFATEADQPGAGVLLVQEVALPIGDAPGAVGGASALVLRRWGSAEVAREVGASGEAHNLPLAPVHLRAEALDDGGAVLRWTRRSRAGFGWGADEAALEGGAVDWLVTLGDAAPLPVDGHELRLGAAAVADQRARGPLRLTVRQTDSRAQSAPASRTLRL